MFSLRMFVYTCTFESLFEVVVHCYIMYIICNVLYVYKLLNSSCIPGSYKVTSNGQICELHTKVQDITYCVTLPHRNIG